MPRPSNPILRPAYQGSNPVADIFSMWALRTTVEMLPRVAKNTDDHEALRQMLLAASFAGPDSRCNRRGRANGRRTRAVSGPRSHC